MRPEGLLTIRSPDSSLFKARLDLSPADRRAWGLAPDEVPLGHNLFVDSGRQALCYAFGNKVGDYTVQKVGFGTGTSVPKMTDVALESPAEITTGVYTKLVDGVDWPAPFVIQVTFTIGGSECNGLYLTEFGLFTANDVLLARWIETVGINKTSALAPQMSWRLRI